jgi:hypothetical protein
MFDEVKRAAGRSDWWEMNLEVEPCFLILGSIRRTVVIGEKSAWRRRMKLSQVDRTVLCPVDRQTVQGDKGQRG